MRKSLFGLSNILWFDLGLFKKGLRFHQCQEPQFLFVPLLRRAADIQSQK